MHGAVAPNSRALNDVIGSVAVSLYAWFGYPEMFKAHWAHHNNCGEQGEDPDFHKGARCMQAHARVLHALLALVSRACTPAAV